GLLRALRRTPARRAVGRVPRSAGTARRSGRPAQTGAERVELPQAPPLIPAFAGMSGRGLERNYWQDNARRALGVVEHRVGGHPPAGVGVQRLAGVGVDVEAREVARRDVYAD